MQLDTNIESYYVGLAAVKSGEAIAQSGKFDLMGKLDESYSQYTSDWMNIIKAALKRYMRKEV